MAFNKLAARLARLNAWAVIPAALVAAIVVSCEHPVTDPSSSIAQLVVSPQNVTLQQNQAEDFLAVGFTATGDSADIAVSWGATGGSIDSSSAGKRHYGHYTSAICGTFTVTATSHPGNVSTAASVTVTGCPLPVASVSVTPATATIGVGQTAQYAAITRDAFGNPLGGADRDLVQQQPGGGDGERRRASDGGGGGCGDAHGDERGEERDGGAHGDQRAGGVGDGEPRHSVGAGGPGGAAHGDPQGCERQHADRAHGDLVQR